MPAGCISSIALRQVCQVDTAKKLRKIKYEQMF